MNSKSATSRVANHNFNKNSGDSTTIFNVEHIPAAMTKLNQWLLWRLEGGKKIPLNTAYRKTDPTKGFSFAEVTAAYNPDKCNGLGFVVGSGIVCVDVDHCVADGKASELAEQLAEELDTYVELSQSGTGLHLFYIDTEAPAVGRKNSQLEIYSHKHYIAMTGISISNSELAVLPGKTAELLEKYFPAQTEPKAERSETEHETNNQDYAISNEEVLLVAKIIQNDVFQKLFYDGDTTGYASQSEADAALLVKLALFTGCCEEQMRELFSQSALGKREKWLEREDYQDLQIARAIAYSRKHYKDSLLLTAIQLSKFTLHPDKLTSELFSAAVRCKSSIKYLAVWDLFRETVKQHKTQLNISMGEFNSRIKLFENSLKQSQANQEEVEIKQVPTLTLPEPYNAINYIIPDGYIVNQAGMYYLTDNGYKLLCTSAIYVTRIITDVVSGEQKSQLYTYKHGYGWKVIDFIDNTCLTNAQKLSLLYGKHNTSINSTTSHQLIKYLDLFIAVNHENIQQLQSTKTMGWYRNTFVTPYNTQKYLVDCDSNPFAKCIQLQGTLEDWKKIAIPAFEQSLITRFTMSACFATVLLKPLNHRSFNIYLWGTSKIGKSTLLQLCASIWGTSGIISSFGGTLNGYIIKAVEHTDFPLMLNDKQQMRENFNINRLLMTLSNGQSDPKMTKEGISQPEYSWRTIGLFNGEEPLIEDNATDGVHTRTVTLHSDSIIIPEQLAKSVWATVVHSNYGHAGKLWVDYIQTADWSEITYMYQNLYDTLKQKFAKHHEEHISYVALVAITEKLVCDNILNIPSNYIAMAHDVLYQIPVKQQLSNPEKFWEHLISWISINHQHFKRPAVEMHTDCWGEYKDSYLAITKSALATEFKNWGNFNVTKVINDLYTTQNLLAYTDKNNNLYKTWNCTINGVKNIKCIKVSMNSLVNT